MAASRIVGNLRVNLGLDASGFSAGVKETQATMSRLASTMRKIGVAVAAAATATGYAVSQSARDMDAIGKASQKIGIPVSEFSALRHAADMSGVSLEQLQGGLRGLSRVMVQTPDELKALGVAVRDAEGNMRPTREVLADIADRLAAMPEGAQRTNLAMRLMGEAGTQLVPMLAGGSAALNTMMKEAADLGLVLDQQTVAAATDFNDNLARLGAAMRGLMYQVTASLAPALKELTDRFRAGLQEGGALRLMFQSVRLAGSALVQVLFVVADNFKHIVDVMRVVVGVKLALWAGSAIGGFIAMARAVRIAGLASVVFATAARGKIVALATLAAVVAKLTGTYEGLERWVKQTGEAIAKAIPPELTAGLAAIKDDILGLGGAIDETDRRAAATFAQAAKAAELAAASVGKIPEAATRIAPVVQEAASGVEEAAASMNRSFGQTFASIVTGASSARSALNQLANSLLNSIMTSAGSQIATSLNLGNIFASVTPFAKGGVVNSPTLFGMDRGLGLMAEAGPEAIMPLHRGADGSLGVKGTPAHVVIELSPGLEARLMDNARSEAVQISARTYSRARREGF